jgi:type IV pilus assembly protein PilV
MNNIRQQRGVGLIEVLVTLLILSTSLITLTAMQNRSLQFNQMAYFRSQANIMAYDILDRIRLNKSNLNAYNVALATFDGTTPPAAGNMAATDIFQWRQNIDGRIPSGQGGIECNNVTGICSVTILWGEINSTDIDDDEESTSKFIYSARL